MPITGDRGGSVSSMRRRTLLTIVCAAVTALVWPAGAQSPTVGPEPAPEARVLAISVDGLNPSAIRRLGAAGAPTFYRLLTEGAGNLNARTEYEQNVTLPNHTSMLTGRRIAARYGGHGVTWDDDRPRLTVQRAAGHDVASVFSVVQAAGGEAALFSTKEKFTLYQRSWPEGITRFVADDDQRRLVRVARRDLLTADRDFTFLHVSLPDRAGHAYGGMSRQYLAAVRTTDRQLGTILAALDRSPDAAAGLTIVLTGDHGFMPGRRTHSPRVITNVRVPFLTWGAGVAAGDLYDLNPDYANPGRRHPAYAASRQPVRNGDLGNLAVDLLGLGPIPDSELDADFSLDVQ